jgi:hypothetical protein
VGIVLGNGGTYVYFHNEIVAGHDALYATMPTGGTGVGRPVVNGTALPVVNGTTGTLTPGTTASCPDGEKWDVDGEKCMTAGSGTLQSPNSVNGTDPKYGVPVDTGYGNPAPTGNGSVRDSAGNGSTEHAPNTITTGPK